ARPGAENGNAGHGRKERGEAQGNVPDEGRVGLGRLPFQGDLRPLVSPSPEDEVAAPRLSAIEPVPPYGDLEHRWQWNGGDDCDACRHDGNVNPNHAADEGGLGPGTADDRFRGDRTPRSLDGGYLAV